MSSVVESENSICLRPATVDDSPLLLEIYASTRADELALVSWWTDDQKSAFVKMQSDAQHEHYRNVYPQALYLVITKNEMPVGRLYLAEKESELRILDVTLLPAERNRGVGSYLLRQLIEQSIAKQKALTINVEGFNPSLRLFERLGFVKWQENGFYCLMKREPDESDKPSELNSPNQTTD
jgi:ribosomal protein S18 acetylase RimI-like enzyme